MVKKSSIFVVTFILGLCLSGDVFAGRLKVAPGGEGHSGPGGMAIISADQKGGDGHSGSGVYDGEVTEQQVLDAIYIAEDKEEDAAVILAEQANIELEQAEFLVNQVRNDLDQ